MSFVVVKRAIAAAPIKVKVYNSDGEEVEIGFVAQYQRHTREQLNDLQDGIANQIRIAAGLEPIATPKDGETSSYPYATDVDLIEAKMVGWVGVSYSSGERIPFNKDELGRVLADWPEMVAPLVRGFFDAHREVQQKN